LNSYGGLQLEEFPLRAKAAAEQTLAEAHTTKRAISLIEAAGARVEHLPAYSPDFIPIDRIAILAS